MLFTILHDGNSKSIPEGHGVHFNIRMDGALLPHVYYILVSQPTRKFPANVTANLPNIKAYPI